MLKIWWLPTCNSGTQNLQLPAVSRHSFELPSVFIMFEAHRNSKWDKAGAYMPSCFMIARRLLC